jgi:general secretion pathway protein A
MYLNHYGLERLPFSLSADPAFLWAGKKHQAALDTLREGILENRGFVLLTGEVGTGKTTLVNAFSNLNEIATITVTIPDPDMEPLDFLNFVASEFGMGRRFGSREDFEHHFKGFLLRSYATYKKVLVIIDEAQRLNSTLIQAVRDLANLELGGRRMLKIFFVGQPEFADMLMEEENAAVRGEVVAAHHLEPLEVRETAEYIIHRVTVAGGRQAPFTPQAILRVHAFAGGFPRTINVLCDHCLLRGFAAGVRRIDVDIVSACADDLQLKPQAPRAKTHALPFQVRAAEESLIAGGGSATGAPRRKRLAVLLVAALLLSAGGLIYHYGWHLWIVDWIQKLAARFF